MSDLLSDRAAVSPESTALYVPEYLDEPLSYAALLDRVRADRERLEHTGICAGERVGFIMENRPELVSLFFAVLQGSYTPVFFHHRATAAELRKQWEDVDASILICSSETEEIAREAVDHGPVLNVDQPTREGVTPFQESNQATPRTISERADEPYVILFTSGSTGAPKPVCLTVDQLTASAHASACRLGHLSSDVWYDPLPIHHMGGLAPIIRSTLYGSAVLVTSFSADEVPNVFQEFDVTAASMVPTMLSRILKKGHWSSAPDALRFILLGGAAVPEDLIRQARDRNLPVYPTYGMTETASQVATATPRQCFDDPTTVGYPLLQTEVRICDEDGECMEPGEEGMIHVRGPSVMEGYFHRPMLNDRVFTEHGFRTGDRGYLDEHGHLHVLDDRTDQIITGGEKVNPDEVEDVLTSHASVRDAAVFGVEDDEWGERVVALVVPSDDEVSESDLRSTLKDRLEHRLAPYKHPKQIAFVQEVPRTPEGGLKKDEARIRTTEASEEAE